MKVIIDIPNYEFNNDIADKFQDYFERVKADIADGTLCGNYELETTDMFLASFKRMQVLPENATNGDMIKAMFPNAIIEINELGSMVHVKYDNHTCWVNYELEWWNAPYKESEGANENS